MGTKWIHGDGKFVSFWFAFFFFGHGTKPITSRLIEAYRHVRGNNFTTI